MPEGDVIALEEVLGISKPAAAIIGTIMGEILLPGIPPIECFPKVGSLKSNWFPASAIAFENSSSSNEENPEY